MMSLMLKLTIAGDVEVDCEVDVEVEVDYDVDVEVDNEIRTVASIPSPSPTTASKYDQDVHHDCQHCKRDSCCEHVLNNSRSNLGELYVNE